MAEQRMRLAAFRTAHPEVDIGQGRQLTQTWWVARIPLQDGEQVIARTTLRELLDRLDDAIPP